MIKATETDEDVRQHVWEKTMEGWDSFASCKHCGKVNNPENIGGKCTPLLTMDDITNYLNPLWL